MRRTKIVATLGPATDDPKVLDDIIAAGVDVVRINFSHGSHEEHTARVETVRNRARAHGRQVGVLADLQGPKIRIDRFLEGKIELIEGELFILDAALDSKSGTSSRVGIAYKDLPNDVKRGDTLLLDDGRIVLWVDQVDGSEVRCKVIVGGELSDKKGINRQGGGLSAPALTEKDREDIKCAAALGADYVAISFPRTAADVEEARELLRAAGGQGSIMAKIERAEALDVLEEIISVSDAIMVARGDLGVEIGDAELPAVQKRIISMARTMDRVVLTATQMMESMINNQIPTRAEVFDVANAVLDGTDAVMLSAETAAGKYPAKVIKAMDRICRSAEKQRLAKVSDHRINTRFRRSDEAIAMASMYTANHLGVKAIAALTESGSTPLWMSRISSGIPIYALTGHVETRRKVTLYRGVYPVSFDSQTTDHAEINKEAIDELVRRGAVRKGDLVIITKGDLLGQHGGTNAMKIAVVGELELDANNGS
ncbi:pyruvate kinase [Solemya pervernicosa gill symbiont]|uniref:Pyruvate kinase n=2 Tax=Gammaproteobacteria incertae sedis TaxID=118884 RepID=A0A1T2LA07_9GAMM|nr:pyruvate kinase [Candidatus Reidiella endopervernicosa]OOZ41910.1 pyruvate kinase [Solemya pervernicosa gill symbiont]QKQ24872.1 pyruvate kinase [Candidatus Reidiella endopervernicosa]